MALLVGASPIPALTLLVPEANPPSSKRAPTCRSGMKGGILLGGNARMSHSSGGVHCNAGALDRSALDTQLQVLLCKRTGKGVGPTRRRRHTGGTPVKRHAGKQ